MNIKTYFKSIICIFIALQSCDKDSNSSANVDISLPELGTIGASDITKNSAKAGGNIYSYGNSVVSKSGVIWGQDADLGLANNLGMTENGSRVGTFYSLIKNLQPGETYYVRSYATNKAGTAYGEVMDFTTGFGDVIDYDGNVYTPVTIGNQVWLKESLKVRHYRNGDPISNIESGAEWRESKSGAYAVYPGVPNYADELGLLYNWYAASDARNIAPEGWRVPTRAEIAELVQFAGGTSIGGHALKVAGDESWWANGQSTNSSGFGALASGYRDAGSGSFVNHHASFYAWAFDAASDENAWVMGLAAGNGSVDLLNYSKRSGLSIRLIKE